MAIQDQLGKTIEELEKEVIEAKKRLLDAKKARPREEVRDYEFLSPGGTTRLLSELFGASKDLIVVHNMGQDCPYCTLWGDGLNGLAGHISRRAPLVVSSPDDPDAQAAFARSRGWTFPMVSTKGTTFASDMGFEPNPGAYWPGVTTFVKTEEGRICRVASAMFGPGDDFCAVWPLLDLLADGANGWEPDFSYPPVLR